MLLLSYLEGTHLTIGFANDLLKWILNLSDASKRLVRWCLRLSELDIDVAHGAGLKHHVADAMSGLRTDGKGTIDLDHDRPACNVGNTEATAEKIPQVQACTKCDVADSPMVGRSDEDHI